jgi:hypothetical protein
METFAMQSRNSFKLGRCILLAAVLVCSVSCIDTASSTNDSTQSAAGTGVSAGSGGGSAGTGAAGMSASAGTGGRAESGSGGRSGSAGGGTAGVMADEDGGVIVEQPDAATGEGAAGEPGGEGAAGGTSEPPPVTAPDPSLVAGTAPAAMCQSATPVMNGMCAGWFCGVNQETIAKAVDPTAVCGGDVELLCRGDVANATATCARMLKQTMLGATDAELRPLIEQCVYENQEIKDKVPPTCLSCTIDVAECASQNCLIECLNADNPGCDTCRLENGCDQMVFPCGGLPSPF